HFTRPVNGDDLIAFQRLVRRVPVADPVMRYALSIVRTSRPKSKNAPESVSKFVAFGASVRGAQYLVLGAKARALTSGRYHVSYEDIKAMAYPVLRHRVLLNFRAEAEGMTTDTIIDDLLSAVAVPKLEYACYLPACVTYLAQKQRDRVGIITFDSDIVTHVPPSAKHFNVVLHTLDRAKGDRAGNLTAPLAKMAEHFKRRGILVL